MHSQPIQSHPSIPHSVAQHPPQMSIPPSQQNPQNQQSAAPQQPTTGPNTQLQQAPPIQTQNQQQVTELK